MEIKDIIKKQKIVGIISNYKSQLKKSGKISDLDIKNIKKGLKIVGLNENILDKDISELSISEKWKIELLTKLQMDTIIVGNLSSSLILRDRELTKKLLKKLSNNYNKKIVVIDSDVNSFINLAENIIVLKDKNIVYETTDFYDAELYKFVEKPKIIEFINYVNKKDKKLNNNLEIYELIKDIYRSVS